MDQKVIAGVGNVYRAEVLFRHGIDPYRAGRDLTRAEWDAIWADLVALMREGVREQPHRHRPPRAHARGDGPPAARGRPRRRGLRLPQGRPALPHLRRARSAPPISPPATSSGAPPARRRLTGSAGRVRPQNPCGSQGAGVDAERHRRLAPAPPAAAPAPARPPRQRGQRHAAQIGRAQLPYGQREIGRVRRSARRRALGVAGQPPTPRVPGAEGVLDLQHHVHRRLVRPRLQRRAHLHQPYVQRVPHPQLAPPDVGDQVLPGRRRPAGSAPPASTSGRCRRGTATAPRPPPGPSASRSLQHAPCPRARPAPQSRLDPEARVPDRPRRPARRPRTAAATRRPARSPGRAACSRSQPGRRASIPGRRGTSRAYTASHASSASRRAPRTAAVRRPCPSGTDSRTRAVSISRVSWVARCRSRTGRRSPARRP